MTVKIISYDTDHDDLDYKLDTIVKTVVKLHCDKIYRYHPTDSWWDDRKSFIVLGAKNRREAFEAMLKESKRQGFTFDNENLYGA